MALFSHSIASLLMDECGCASLTFTSFTDVPSLFCAQLSERLSVHMYVGRWFWLDAVDENFALLGADFHAVFSRCFLQSLIELLEFFFTAYEHIDVVGKLQSGRPPNDTSDSGLSVSSVSSTASSAT